jgi:hypothetical protein
MTNLGFLGQHFFFIRLALDKVFGENAKGRTYVAQKRRRFCIDACLDRQSSMNYAES